MKAPGRRFPLATEPKATFSTAPMDSGQHFFRQRTEKLDAAPIVYAGPYSVDAEQKIVHQQADLS